MNVKMKYLRCWHLSPISFETLPSAMCSFFGGEGVSTISWYNEAAVLFVASSSSEDEKAYTDSQKQFSSHRTDTR